MTDKFQMTREQIVTYAKRNIVDYIWKSAKMEGIAVTFPDTDAVCRGARVANLTVDEIVLINNLKHAWAFILETLEYPTDYPLICKINQTVGSNLIYGAGSIRTMPVTIGGTDWIPDLPLESVIKEEVSEILQLPLVTDRALSLALYIMRKQMFIDGNKRTALLTANHIMISAGVGIVSIANDDQSEFFKLALEFYETNSNEKAKIFLYDRCIHGAVF